VTQTRPFPSRPSARRVDHVLAALAAGLALLLGSPGRAQPAAAERAPATPSAAAKAEARERFDRGLRLFEQGDNASALAEFKRANDLIPNPLVVYNMGLVYAAMERPVEAVAALDAFLAQATAAQRSQRRNAERVRAEQAARVAYILVKTEVAATINVDGIEVGHTPMTEPIAVASGAHVVGAQAQGYLPTRKAVTLAGQITETVVLDLVPAAARKALLSLTSTPLGVEMLVNNQSVGVTPLPASVSVPPGEVRVEARRPGYLRAERTVSLGDGAQGELAFVLQEDPAAPRSSRGVLRIMASEADVDVSIDGTPRTVGAAGLLLPEGRHELRVARPGFEPFEKTVDVTGGGETPLAVVLLPTPETRANYEASARTRRIIGWSTLATGAGLLAAGVGYGLSKLGDVSDRRKDLEQVLANEANPNHQCFTQNFERTAYRCDEVHSTAQDRVDAAVLRRNLGFIGAGVGLVVAGIGGYLLLTGDDPDRYRKPATIALSDAVVWWDERGGGLALAGRF
jgi:hypothetical protein